MVRPEKVKLVEEISKMIEKYPVVGLANVMDLPTRQFQIIRKKLKEKGFVIKVVKKSILQRAIEKVSDKKKGIDKFLQYIKKGERISPAIILGSGVNSFKLYKIIDENKSPAPAKPGAIAPKDIVIPAGPTPFGPGPMIGELSRLGFKVKVEKGKIVIQEDKVIVKKGEVISEKVAEILNKFGIEPLEIKLNLVAVWENGIIYTADVLAIDEKKYIEDISRAFRTAINLMIETGIPIEGYMDIIVRKAVENAIKLSLEVGLPDKTNIDILLRRAIGIAVSVSSLLPEELRPAQIKIVKAPKEEKKEEKKEEAKKEEEEKKQEEALSGLGALFGL